MSLEKLLEEKKSTILKRWFELVLETYPADTRQFLKKSKNRFSNPVGHEISRGIEGIFDQLLQGGSSNELSLFLDKVIRIRAVQDFRPSLALGFIFELKKLIREELADVINDSQMSEDLSRFERQVDQLGLMSLDLYVKCREKLYELRVKEAKNRVGRLIERANMICGVRDKERDPEVRGTDNLT